MQCQPWNPKNCQPLLNKEFQGGESRQFWMQRFALVLAACQRQPSLKCVSTSGACQRLRKMQCYQRRRQWYLQGQVCTLEKNLCWIEFEWYWHWPSFGLNRLLNYGQDILFAKKLGSAFWALVVIELHGANATIKGWTKGPWHVVVDSHLELTFTRFELPNKEVHVPQSDRSLHHWGTQLCILCYHLRTSSSCSFQVGIYQGFFHALILVRGGVHNNIVSWLEIFTWISMYIWFMWHLHVFKITFNQWRFRIASKSLIESSDQQLREMCCRNWLISAWWVQLPSLVMLTLKSYHYVKLLMDPLPTYFCFTVLFAEWWTSPQQGRRFFIRQLRVGSDAFVFTSGQPIRCARHVQRCGRASKMHRNLDANHSYQVCFGAADVTFFVCKA